MPRYLRREINERTTRDGTVLHAPDLEEAVEIVEDLVEDGVESLAVSLLHSYRNPESEQALKAAIASRFPTLSISISLDVAPFINEYERTSTTVADCYVKPTVFRYLAQVEGLLSEVARVHRFMKGSGLPIVIPVVDLVGIGAGGSIAWLDQMRLLKVGPRSAGAGPGPACYGMGGDEPAVTGSDLALGYLDPGYFLGGRMKLDQDAGLPAISPLAGAIGMENSQVAAGIHDVVNENLAASA